MIGRHKAVKAIKKGDLEELKKIIENEPKTLDEDRVFGWNANYKKMCLLHIAAYCNKPEIVKFLVDVKKVDIHRKHYGMAALHFAGRASAYYDMADMVKTLLALGADPCLESSNGYMPHDFFKDQPVKKLLQSAYKEQLLKDELAKQGNSGPSSEEQQQPLTEKEAADRIKGFWKLSDAPDEVIYERDMSAQKLRLTETFNFAAELRVLIVRDLETGSLSQPETKLLSEIPKRAEQAKAEFDARYAPPKRLVLGQ